MEPKNEKSSICDTHLFHDDDLVHQQPNKVEPKDFLPELVNLAVANDDDCTKSREKVKAYFEVNAPAFIEAINKAGDDAEKAGKSSRDAVDELAKAPKSLEK